MNKLLIGAVVVVSAIILWQYIYVPYHGQYIYKADMEKMAQLNSEINWLEAFYSQNGRYPSPSEFGGKYPATNIEQKYYASEDYDPSKGPPKKVQDQTDFAEFTIEYRLTSDTKKDYAIGGLNTSWSNFTGWYWYTEHRNSRDTYQTIGSQPGYAGF